MKRNKEFKLLLLEIQPRRTNKYMYMDDVLSAAVWKCFVRVPRPNYLLKLERKFQRCTLALKYNTTCSVCPRQ